MLGRVTDQLSAGRVDGVYVVVGHDPEPVAAEAASHGARVVTNEDYDAGMLTESFSPDLVVLDYMLPDINGDLVCKRLKAREQSSQTRVIFVSGVIEPDEIEKLKASGADDFVQKPLNIQMLIEKIADLLGV